MGLHIDNAALIFAGLICFSMACQPAPIIL